MFVQEYEFLINRKVNKCNLLAYLLLTALNKVCLHVDESPAKHDRLRYIPLPSQKLLCQKGIILIPHSPVMKINI